MQSPFVVRRSRRERVVGHALSLVGASPRRVATMEWRRRDTRWRRARDPARVPHGCLGSKEPVENAQRLQVPRARTSSKLNARLHNRCRSHTPRTRTAVRTDQYLITTCTDPHPAHSAHAILILTIVSFATIARVVPDHAARPRSAQLRRPFRGLARRRGLPCTIVSFATIALFGILRGAAPGGPARLCRHRPRNDDTN